MNPQQRMKELERRYQLALRYLAVMVERAGGEVLILPSELEPDRTFEKDDVAGAVRLKTERA